LRQAYDYWQDQPGNYNVFFETVHKYTYLLLSLVVKPTTKINRYKCACSYSQYGVNTFILIYNMTTNNTTNNTIAAIVTLLPHMSFIVSASRYYIFRIFMLSPLAVTMTTYKYIVHHY
jgi:hypothetical protein